MKRSMLQVYTKNSVQAVELYQRAFDARLLDFVKDEEGNYYHSELDVYGQILSVAELPKNEVQLVTGNAMQFCLHFDKTEETLVQKAYDVLKEGGQIRIPLAPCDFSPGMADLIDVFGVRWCLFFI